MIRPTRALALLALALPIALPASAPAQRPAEAGLLGARPVERRFQDWLLVCDNTKVCRAQATGAGGSLMVRRDPGPNGTVLVVLDGQEPTADTSIPDIASIRVTGGVAPGGWRLDRPGESARLQGQAALTFLWAIAPARTVSYRAGGETLEVSLAGLTAALLAMDEVQGRAGTISASVRPGARPATAVPAALPVPVLRVPRPATAPVPRGFAAAVRRASAAALRRGDCETTQHARAQDSAVALGRDEVLVFLGCRLFNTGFATLLLRAPRAAPHRASAVVLPRAPGEDGGDNGDGVYTDLEWNARTAILSSGGHSCAGSCGSRTDWTWDGRAFRLARHFTYEGGGAELLDHYRTVVRIRR
ncbi:MAG TPA: DUF1176 domain-containing protein [Allosphingosinicella sp.]|nr:DUF1176 domain-containing protein [Allosphingosinicella sp.]